MIINPWIFYVINVLVSLEDFLFIMALVAILAIAISYLFAMSEKQEIEDAKDRGKEKDTEMYNKLISWFKKSVIAFVICSAIVIAIPAKETMYTMLVSSYVTTDNIKTATEVIKDSVDYIFEKINGENND